MPGGPHPGEPLLDPDEMVALLVDEVRDYAILILDVEGRVASWNAGARRFKGYDAEEIIGKSFAVFYAPDEIAAGLPEEMLAAARAEGRTAHEGWRVRKDGSRFWASVVITALRDEHGTLRGYGKVTRDLSDRHHAELEVQAASERFRAAFTHAPIGIALSDLRRGRDRNFIDVNPALARMLGYETCELAAQRVTSVTHPEDRAAAEHLLRELLEGRSVAVELRLVRKDGREVWALVSSTPLPEPAGEAPRTAISQILDISERRRFESQLRQLADHDALTGLFNRHRFEVELARVTGEASRSGRSSALIVLDLDGFKEVNDRFGHPTGDELVRRVSELLRETVRAGDVVARLGGDEFAVILPEADQGEAERLADRVLEAIREHGWVAVAQRHTRVTASIGITVFDGQAALTAPELAVEGDIAMYEAKALGRNRCSSYDRGAPRHRTVSARQSWLERLREAIDEDRFVLHAQPIRGLSQHELPHYELLLRLLDDDGRLIPPGAFLHQAERFNMMGEIDRWVLTRAVRLLAAHQRAGHDIRLSVNLSGHTMNDAALPRELAGLLTEFPVAPGRLIIEVTETAAIVDIERAQALAVQLRGLGCQFALDDFGAGFASFSYLKHFAFDYVKIDGEFIRQLARTPTDQLVVRAVVDIARGLRTRTVAEFVGDDSTVELLRSLGIDFGQGYHLGRPGPLEEVLPRLERPALAAVPG